MSLWPLWPKEYRQKTANLSGALGTFGHTWPTPPPWAGAKTHSVTQKNNNHSVTRGWGGTHEPGKNLDPLPPSGCQTLLQKRCLLDTGRGWKKIWNRTSLFQHRKQNKLRINCKKLPEKMFKKSNNIQKTTRAKNANTCLYHRSDTPLQWVCTQLGKKNALRQCKCAIFGEMGLNKSLEVLSHREYSLHSSKIVYYPPDVQIPGST